MQVRNTCASLEGEKLLPFTFKSRTFAAFAFAATLMYGLSTNAASAQVRPVLVAPQQQQASNENAEGHEVDYAALPIIRGYYKGRVALYVSTDTSDQTVARANGLNYVPRLAGSIAGSAVDDIYIFPNGSQANVIPSAPTPTGPENANPAYTPLWQVSYVTWNPGTRPRKLRSEEAILQAHTLGLLTIRKTNIVINCPVFFTPQGGLLPGVRYQR